MYLSKWLTKVRSQNTKQLFFFEKENTKQLYYYQIEITYNMIL